MISKGILGQTKNRKQKKTVLVPADKTRNVYELEKLQYRKLLTENITKHYKPAPEGTYDHVNAEAQGIATPLKVADRMDTLAR